MTCTRCHIGTLTEVYLFTSTEKVCDFCDSTKQITYVIPVGQQFTAPVDGLYEVHNDIWDDGSYSSQRVSLYAGESIHASRVIFICGLPHNVDFGGICDMP